MENFILWFLDKFERNIALPNLKRYNWQITQIWQKIEALTSKKLDKRDQHSPGDFQQTFWS